MQSPPTPKRPTHIPDYAEVCLAALVAHGLGDKVSLGGAFALLHYLDYRSTYDVDAWWQLTATTQERQQVVNVLEQTLKLYGTVRIRSFGDVTSVELATDARKKAFSFQIAQRSAQLSPSTTAMWLNIQLDSLADLIANKMTALVQRGAPRDFRDIYAICQSKLASMRECWQLWQKRQELTDDDADMVRAKLAVTGHLERIEQYRPLAKISDAVQHTEALRVRQWYKQEFLNASLD